MKTQRSKSKTQLFKNLIKEAVREVVKEELPQIIREELRKGKPMVEAHQDFIKDYSPNYKEFLPKSPAKPVGPNYSYQDTKTSPVDPIKRILAQTAKSMTQEDYQSIRMNSDMVEMNHPVGVVNGTLAQNMNVGEIEEWQPTNMKDFNFPM